ncbi:uncharacterized protein LOC135956600 [Calliphora vicina]|uniref:uncharacterized protein LOC135956600 n=1 Tax=Calliphora vicina TaxID=7373 RepID=UPI00325B468B
MFVFDGHLTKSQHIRAGSTYRNDPKIFGQGLSTQQQQLYNLLHLLALLLRILLVRAGVEVNPGPWFCTVCQNLLHHMSTQLRCNSCLGWCHLRNCSGLNHEREWSENYVAPFCQRGSSSASSASSSSSYATPPPSPPQSQQRQQVQQQQQPPPLTPSIAVRRPGVISILQLNCNGLQGKISEITRFMRQHNIVVAAVQETKLTSNSSLQSCNGYNVLRKDRTRGNGGGIAFIIHNTVQYRALSLDLNSRDQYLEVQGIAVRSGDTELELYNVYIPPVASCPTGYHPDIRNLLDGDTRLVLGDFNAQGTRSSKH